MYLSNIFLTGNRIESCRHNYLANLPLVLQLSYLLSIIIIVLANSYRLTGSETHFLCVHTPQLCDLVSIEKQIQIRRFAAFESEIEELSNLTNHLGVSDCNICMQNFICISVSSNW